MITSEKTELDTPSVKRVDKWFSDPAFDIFLKSVQHECADLQAAVSGDIVERWAPGPGAKGNPDGDVHFLKAVEMEIFRRLLVEFSSGKRKLWQTKLIPA